jgi:hypothetical protein
MRSHSYFDGSANVLIYVQTDTLLCTLLEVVCVCVCVCINEVTAVVRHRHSRVFDAYRLPASCDGLLMGSRPLRHPLVLRRLHRVICACQELLFECLTYCCIEVLTSQ